MSFQSISTATGIFEKEILYSSKTIRKPPHILFFRTGVPKLLANNVTEYKRPEYIRPVLYKKFPIRFPYGTMSLKSGGLKKKMYV